MRQSNPTPVATPKPSPNKVDPYGEGTKGLDPAFSKKVQEQNDRLMNGGKPPKKP